MVAVFFFLACNLLKKTTIYLCIGIYVCRSVCRKKQKIMADLLWIIYSSCHIINVYGLDMKKRAQSGQPIEVQQHNPTQLYRTGTHIVVDVTTYVSQFGLYMRLVKLLLSIGNKPKFKKWYLFRVSPQRYVRKINYCTNSPTKEKNISRFIL